MLSRESARRYGRQIRLAGIGEDGQAKLCAARVAPSAAGFAAVIEARYLVAAGITVTDDLADRRATELPELGLRHAAARDVGEGALRALVAIRRALGEDR